MLMHFIGYSDAAKDPEMQEIYSNASSLNAPLKKSKALNQNMAVSRPKKRKNSTFLQSPWHKVYLQPSKICHSFSVSEQEWALATNTLCEKMDPNEVVSPSKKRLVLSTNLMQQLLRPAPTFVFSDINAPFNYETMLYFESRITLADACSLTNFLIIFILTFLKKSLWSSGQTSNTSSDQENGYYTLVKAFMEKLHKLENDFQSLETTTTSILDIFLEIEDTEKFSMLNRLAKFHSRTKTIKRSVPQRYVDLQKPAGKLPERLHCLPL
ncbi:unnamed protein product [Eruca vesicaria subsp. sativa]|uniref:Uncharacterized protein n=1 Tax=Eruca vesicaria subsp. sativa TaxID=29727 RepID=A0ABC8LML7_ERUVS|nr:unnamed protein product [Eruca vesicaria subsp. sativa]